MTTLNIAAANRYGRPGPLLAGLLGMLLLAPFDANQASAAAANNHTDIRRDAVVRAVEDVMPAVVNISTETVIESNDPLDQLFRDFFGQQRGPARAQSSLGSGVIIDETGYLLTNFHVVRRATRITVTLSDGREREARLVNATARSDVALVRIIPRGRETFKAVRLAADDDLLLGETVLALGNPFGLGISVSRGILSSRTRRPPINNVPLEIEDWLQTDAAINPGNSGGPLVNVRGELIGISVAVFREGQGIGFAIPVKRVSEALSEIFTPESIRSIWFGARFHGGPSGPVVVAVQAGSPAEKGGLRKGDRIVRVNDRTPRTVVELNRELIGAGQETVELTVQRGGESRPLSIKPVPERDIFTPALVRQKLGVTLQEITAESAAEAGLGPLEGFLVVAVEKAGPAAEADLAKGCIIRAIDGEMPSDLVQMAKLLYTKKRGERVRLHVLVPRQRGRFIQLYQGTTDVVLR